ncbi:MAG: site-2 protease family protein [Saprospiraceae bacterium]|nr:site-2 protease family protein [Saprospiraceae bacterium]
MKLSLNLGRIAGIQVFIHWTFLILIAWILFSHLGMGHGWQQSLMGVVFILVLFACVLLHELGHALTGKRFNVRTKNIVLLPIGGVANMEKMPEKPVQELWVALAGPAVNLVIAVILFFVLQQTGGMPDILNMDSHMSSSNFLFNLFLVNILLAAFNLIPAFPMDGGRVLRALLAMKFDRAKATEIAARTGQALAIGFVFLGIFSNVWLVFIGLFVFLGAGAESSYETMRSVLSKYTVRDVLMKNFTVLQVGEPIEKAVEQLLNGQDKAFLVKDGEHVSGFITRDEIIRGLTGLGKTAPLGNIMKRDFPQLSPDMPLDKAHELMTSRSIAFSPVFQDGDLVGVLDLENITELIMVDKAVTQS